MTNCDKGINDKSNYTSDETMTKSSEHWFRLFDSADGKPYKNSTATRLSSTPGSIFLVDQFQDAVKMRCPNTLS
jgi:hypothetical protein